MHIPVDDYKRAEMRERLCRLGARLDGQIRRFHAAGVTVSTIAERMGLEPESVRAAIRGWASTQARVKNARRRRA